MNINDVQSIFGRVAPLKDIVITNVIALKGDASSRRYFRVYCASGPYPSLIIVELAGGMGPIAAGGVTLSQDETFILVERFLSDIGVRHTRIVADLRSVATPDSKLLVLEDLGDVALWRLSREHSASDVRKVIEVLGPDYVFEAYKRAIDIILKIQSAKVDCDSIVFKRTLNEPELYVGLRRFIDFYLIPHGYSETDIANTDSCLKMLSARVSQHPRITAHRDYMAWNIHLMPDGQPAILDFQDMLQTSLAYDLMCLLTDRDTDCDLGLNLEERLRRYFYEHSSVVKSLRLSYDHLMVIYNEALLLRSIRLIGQFTNLAQTKNSPFYSTLVPGSIRRAKRARDHLDGYDSLKLILDSL